jgi:hypothetical protein
LPIVHYAAQRAARFKMRATDIAGMTGRRNSAATTVAILRKDIPEPRS